MPPTSRAGGLPSSQAAPAPITMTRWEALFVAPWGSWATALPVRLGFFILAAALSLFLSYKAVHNQITETQILTEDRVSLAAYLDGSAFRPFAYRFLTPVLVNFAERTLDLPALLKHAPTILQTKAAELCTRATAQPQASCDDVASYAAVAWASCLAFLLVMYGNVQLLFRNPLISFLGVGFTYLVVNAILLARLSHVYDFSVLLIVSALMYCLLRRWTLAFMLLLPFAYATKETLGLWAGVFFVAQIGRMPLARNAALFAAQLVAFVVVHGAIRAHFADNAGFGHEYYLPQQISFFTEHIDLAMLLAMLFALVLVFHDFARKHEVLRRASVVIPPWFVLFMIGGVEREVRVMLEILPLVILLAMDGLVRFIRVPTSGATPAMSR